MAEASHPLIGAWRVESTSDVVEGGDTSTTALQGFFIFTPGRIAVLYGSAEGAETEYKMAWTGAWVAEGDSLDITIDFSTSKFVTGTFTRYFAVDGEAMTFRTALHESKAKPGVFKTTDFKLVRDAG